MPYEILLSNPFPFFEPSHNSYELYKLFSNTGFLAQSKNSQCCHDSPTAEMYLTGFSFLMFNTSQKAFYSCSAQLKLCKTCLWAVLIHSLPFISFNLHKEKSCAHFPHQSKTGGTLWIRRQHYY